MKQVRVMGKREGLLIICSWLISAMGSGQNLVRNDSMLLKKLQDPADPGVSLVKFRLSHELEYTLSYTSLVFYNWQQGEHTSHISLVHYLKYRSQVSGRNLTIKNTFVHSLGILYFPDSILRFQPDENSLDTKLEIRIGNSLTYTIFSTMTTRIFNSYNYSTDNHGNRFKTLNASFLTPFLWTFSTGFGWTFPRLGTLSVGLSSARFTWIRDRAVFVQQNIREFYGVPREKNFRLEYGFSMHLIFDKDFLNRVHWNCDLLMFKNFEKPVDLDLKNLIGIKINKFLKTSLQTHLRYEQEVSTGFQFENLVSLGFYINL